MGSVGLAVSVVCRRLASRCITTVLVVTCTVAWPLVAGAQDGDRWIGTWATGPVSLQSSPASTTNQVNQSPQIHDQTVRQVVRLSIGGSKLRVLFTNQYGTEPLKIAAAHVAIRHTDAMIVESSGRILTFNGEESVTLERGATHLSDAEFE